MGRSADSRGAGGRVARRSSCRWTCVHQGGTKCSARTAQRTTRMKSHERTCYQPILLGGCTRSVTRLLELAGEPGRTGLPSSLASRHPLSNASTYLHRQSALHLRRTHALVPPPGCAVPAGAGQGARGAQPQAGGAHAGGARAGGWVGYGGGLWTGCPEAAPSGCLGTWSQARLASLVQGCRRGANRALALGRAAIAPCAP